MHAFFERRPVAIVRAAVLVPPGPALYADAIDRSRHQYNIEQLAIEINCPEQVIRPIYEKTLARLKSKATVKDYLLILVAKGVRKALKNGFRQH